VRLKWKTREGRMRALEGYNILHWERATSYHYNERKTVGRRGKMSPSEKGEAFQKGKRKSSPVWHHCMEKHGHYLGTKDSPGERTKRRCKGRRPTGSA